MNLIFRLIKTIIVALRASRLAPLDESVANYRVWPHDLDLNMHMNNGRYLTLMDLGRIDMMIRNGLARAAFKHRWRPMVASATIRFRRPLPPFKRFQLHTRIICWDAKWFFMEQRFQVGDELYATSVIKGIFMGPRGKAAPQEIAAAVGVREPSPPMPEAVRAWLEAEL